MFLWSILLTPALQSIVCLILLYFIRNIRQSNAIRNAGNVFSYIFQREQLKPHALRKHKIRNLLIDNIIHWNSNTFIVVILLFYGEWIIIADSKRMALAFNLKLPSENRINILGSSEEFTRKDFAPFSPCLTPNNSIMRMWLPHSIATCWCQYHPQQKQLLKWKGCGWCTRKCAPQTKSGSDSTPSNNNGISSKSCSQISNWT